MSRSTDRDLLFGLLALQNNFIDRDLLVNAFHRWVGDDQVPLDQILLDHGALSPSRHALLAGLVDEHVKAHDGEVAKSLAALSSIESVRDDLSKIADAELYVSLEQVSRVRKAADDDPYRTASYGSLGESTSAGSRFRILRPLEKGGLGQVSIALDQEFDRPVALKEILDRFADDPASRVRFLQEAEITGKLEHPGIIPVYGLGHDLMGRPFYAMRFIEGDSLKTAIAAFYGDAGLEHDRARRGSRLRELLRRFTDVCNAIAYAHSRGVLHRDLKPGNIMLGPYGETLVVDWGLAKPLGSVLSDAPTEGQPPSMSSGSTVTGGPIRLSVPVGSRDETIAGRIVGTPQYASPEQVAGRVDQLDASTDIYGFGATLYTILTGRARSSCAVSARTWKSRSRAIPSAGPARSSTRKWSSSKLRTECSVGRSRTRGRSTRRSPCRWRQFAARRCRCGPRSGMTRRRALAEEVTRWLDDEPVLVYSEPLPERAGRWMRRHRTLVTSAAAVLVFGLLGLGGFATVLTSKNRELDLKNAQMADKNRQMDAQNLELAGKNRELDRQRKRAEAREALAIDAVKKFRDVVQTNPELKNRSELEALRKALLEEPLEFFRKLRDQLQADQDTRPETLARLAQADFELAFTTEEIGSTTDAIRSYAESLAIRERLAREYPTVIAYQSDLAVSQNNIANLLMATGRLDEALASHRNALAISERLARTKPTVPANQSELALSYNNLGVHLDAMGHLAEAIESYRKAVAIRERLVRENPNVAEYQNDLAASHVNLGKLLSETGHPAEALESYRKAVAFRERLVHENPNNTRFQRGLALGHNNLSNLLSDVGRKAEALESHKKARAIRERLAHDNPTITEYQTDLAGSHHNIGNLLQHMDRRAEALESYRKAMLIWERLVRDHPTITEHQRDLALSYNNIGNLLSETGHMTEAIESHRKASRDPRAATRTTIRRSPSTRKSEA